MAELALKPEPVAEPFQPAQYFPAFAVIKGREIYGYNMSKETAELDADEMNVKGNTKDYIVIPVTVMVVGWPHELHA